MMLQHLGKVSVLMLLSNSVSYGAVRLKPQCDNCHRINRLLTIDPQFRKLSELQKENEILRGIIDLIGTNQRAEGESAKLIQDPVNGQNLQQNGYHIQENKRASGQTINKGRSLGIFIVGVATGLMCTVLYYRQKLAKFAKVAVR